MTDADQQAAFIQAICESPFDDGPREMYADWLMERGDPRGEFIRVQLRIAALDVELMSDEDCEHPNCPGCVERRALRQREQELLFWPHGLLTEMLPTIKGLSRWDTGGAYGWYPDGTTGRGRDITAAFRRGFIERVECRMRDWLDHGPALVRAAPITEVRLTDKEPIVSVHQGIQYRWAQRERWRWRNRPQPEPLAHELPEEWFKLLNGKPPGRWHYTTIDAAHADLSRAALAWARERAGLPKLKE